MGVWAVADLVEQTDEVSIGDLPDGSVRATGVYCGPAGCRVGLNSISWWKNRDDNPTVV